MEKNSWYIIKGREVWTGWLTFSITISKADMEENLGLKITTLKEKAIIDVMMMERFGLGCFINDWLEGDKFGYKISCLGGKGEKKMFALMNQLEAEYSARWEYALSPTL